MRLRPSILRSERVTIAWPVLQDLTLPLISLFTGRGFDNVIRETFKSGPQRIEDLWLRCCSVFQGQACMVGLATEWSMLSTSPQQVIKPYGQHELLTSFCF